MWLPQNIGMQDPIVLDNGVVAQRMLSTSRNVSRMGFLPIEHPKITPRQGADTKKELGACDVQSPYWVLSTQSNMSATNQANSKLSGNGGCISDAWCIRTLT